MADKNINKLKDFAWEKVIKQLIKIYKEIEENENN